jgi:hypothetical protein
VDLPRAGATGGYGIAEEDILGGAALRLKLAQFGEK